MTPEVRVVRGDPDEVELAALVAGLVAGVGRAGDLGGSGDGGAGPGHDGPTQQAERARRRWCHAQSPLGGVARPSPDAWRWSARG